MPFHLVLARDHPRYIPRSERVPNAHGHTFMFAGDGEEVTTAGPSCYFASSHRQLLYSFYAGRYDGRRTLCPSDSSHCDSCNALGGTSGGLFSSPRGYVCVDCANELYVRCADCGVAHSEEDTSSHPVSPGEAICEDCLEEHHRRADQEIIADYHGWDGNRNPIRNTWSTAHRGLYFGVELEVEVPDRNTQRVDAARTIRDAVATLPEMADMVRRGRQPIHMENDGSLDRGFEMITLPFGLPQQRVLWRHVLQRRYAGKLRSHQTETCGLHIHVSRNPLTATQIARMVMFMNNPDHEKLIRAIARRYHNPFSQVKAKSWTTAAQSYDRYEVINLTNDRTVEFRIFRGSTNADTVVASLEFVNALVSFCARNIPNEDVTAVKFLSFLTSHSMRRETKTLREYLALRGVTWTTTAVTIGSPVRRNPAEMQALQAAQQEQTEPITSMPDSAGSFPRNR